MTHASAAGQGFRQQLQQLQRTVDAPVSKCKLLGLGVNECLMDLTQTLGECVRLTVQLRLLAVGHFTFPLVPGIRASNFC